ncbi:terminase small subunit [Polluticoccus soli]|uniref:terminase small subunit n=1 Tax=Polluticoccus soli TaxID=3034150 RepID=UPI0023E14F9A|nr:terminase small subunit [Flavipsychrobacter sp. JY13-12]
MLESKIGNDGLTEKQELFCQEYLVDLNQTKAYQRAFDVANIGTAAAEASRLVTRNLKVSARIKQLMNERVERISLNQDWVLLRLQQISDRSMQCEPVMKWSHEEKRIIATGEYVFDSNGANRSTELIGKHMGMFKEKLEVDTNINVELIIQGQKFAKKPTDGAA